MVLSVRPFIYANLQPFSAILFPSKIPQNIFLLTFCRFHSLEQRPFVSHVLGTSMRSVNDFVMVKTGQFLLTILCLLRFSQYFDVYSRSRVYDSSHQKSYHQAYIQVGVPCGWFYFQQRTSRVQAGFSSTLEYDLCSRCQERWL